MIAFAEQIQRLSARYSHCIAAGEEVTVKRYRAENVVIDDASRELTCIINTDSVDLDGEVVDPAGLDFSMFLEKRKVFVDHNYDFDHCIGVLRSLRAYPDKRNVKAWIMHMTAVPGLQNPLADDVLTMAKFAGIGASIGFIQRVVTKPEKGDPDHWHKAKRIIRQAKVFETSLLFVQANEDCGAITDMEELKRLDAIGELVTKGKIKPESAARLGWKDRKLTMPPRRLRMAV